MPSEHVKRSSSYSTVSPRTLSARAPPVIPSSSLDISQAYVVADWPEDHPDIYMELPSIDPKTSKNQYVAHMQKMLYGLKDAGRNFERYLDRFLRKRFDAQPMVADRSVYKIQMGDDVVMCCVFVDDVVFYSTRPKICRWKGVPDGISKVFGHLFFKTPPPKKTRNSS